MLMATEAVDDSFSPRWLLVLQIDDDEFGEQPGERTDEDVVTKEGESGSGDCAHPASNCLLYEQLPVDLLAPVAEDRRGIYRPSRVVGSSETYSVQYDQEEKVGHGRSANMAPQELDWSRPIPEFIISDLIEPRASPLRSGDTRWGELWRGHPMQIDRPARHLARLERRRMQACDLNRFANISDTPELVAVEDLLNRWQISRPYQQVEVCHRSVCRGGVDVGKGRALQDHDVDAFSGELFQDRRHSIVESLE